MLFTFNRIMDIKLFSSFTLCFKETTVEDINSATKKEEKNVVKVWLSVTHKESIKSEN